MSDGRCAAAFLTMPTTNQRAAISTVPCPAIRRARHIDRREVDRQLRGIAPQRSRSRHVQRQELCAKAVRVPGAGNRLTPRDANLVNVPFAVHVHRQIPERAHRQLARAFE